MLIRRNLEGPLRDLAGAMPVVTVTGPRQSGKTTLCRVTFPEKPYVSLEPLDVREYANRDPRGFLREYEGGAILDEVQHAPDLLSYLQMEVDSRPEPGRFILTGSQHFGLTEAISQTLAGRSGILYLLPPSIDELARFGPLPQEPWPLLFMGSFPRIYDRGLDPGKWLADYTTDFVLRDVRQVLQVKDLAAFSTFMQLVAGRTGCELNLSRLGGDAGVTHHTARSWLSVLEASFVCFRLPAWRRSHRKQAVKSPKLHLIDTGLACHLLGITEPVQLHRHPLRGAIFESWVASEVLKSRIHRGLTERLCHFRDAKGLEVDLLIEEGERLTAVEAKSGATVASDFFGPLRKLREIVEAGHPHLAFEARVIFGGDAPQHRGDALVVPWKDIQEHPW